MNTEKIGGGRGNGSGGNVGFGEPGIAPIAPPIASDNVDPSLHEEDKAAFLAEGLNTARFQRSRPPEYCS